MHSFYDDLEDIAAVLAKHVRWTADEAQHAILALVNAAESGVDADDAAWVIAHSSDIPVRDLAEAAALARRNLTYLNPRKEGT